MQHSVQVKIALPNIFLKKSMVATNERILMLEPYYGGSHKSFLTGLQTVLPWPCTLLTLPARKWKARMHLAAPHMVNQIIQLYAQGVRFTGLLTSGFLDVAVLRSLLARAGISLPIGLYFHENQFAYPTQEDQSSRYAYAAINFLSALCADAVAFNSIHNRETFFNGVEGYLQKAGDFYLKNQVESLRASSVILYPGMELEHCPEPVRKPEPPVIIWNHRWEHDKNPEEFFTALFSLAERGVPFQLMVLGESFRNKPSVFTQVKQTLGERILHFGFVPSRKEYLTLLRQGTVVVSTALHEFFGYSVLEAVRAGCRPLVPDRLAYPELFPQEFRYGPGKLVQELEKVLHAGERLSSQQAIALTKPYAWKNLAETYENWFRSRLTADAPLR